MFVPFIEEQFKYGSHSTILSKRLEQSSDFQTIPLGSILERLYKHENSFV